MTRPDMAPYFRAQAKRYHHGDQAPPVPPLPSGVVNVEGTVDSPMIYVGMGDGSLYVWRGGKRSLTEMRGGTRRLLMPERIETTDHHREMYARLVSAKGVQSTFGPSAPRGVPRKKSGRSARIIEHVTTTQCDLTRDQIPEGGRCHFGAPPEQHPAPIR